MSGYVRRPSSDEVDQLLRNAELREALEPYLDESITKLETARIPTPVENDYLAMMLAWEQAPALPISQWFDPPLDPPPPDSLSDAALHELLWNIIHKLYERAIILEFTDHLSDRELYRLVYRDILPTVEKKVDSPGNYFHWDCADTTGDPEIWLKYYASDEERRLWKENDGGWLPEKDTPPYPRRMPRRPM